MQLGRNRLLLKLVFMMAQCKALWRCRIRLCVVLGETLLARNWRLHARSCFCSCCCWCPATSLLISLLQQELSELLGVLLLQGGCSYHRNSATPVFQPHAHAKTGSHGTSTSCADSSGSQRLGERAHYRLQPLPLHHARDRLLLDSPPQSGGGGSGLCSGGAVRCCLEPRTVKF
jgi:hypothetical protein